jgi:hypothetical protein
MLSRTPLLDLVEVGGAVRACYARIDQGIIVTGDRRINLEGQMWPWKPNGRARQVESRPWCSEQGKNRCSGIGVAVNGDVGTMVETVQQLILQYYTDVGNQATEGFESAKRIALLGFGVLAMSMAYVVFVDLKIHIKSGWAPITIAEGSKIDDSRMNVGNLGLFAGAIVEGVAGLQFVLYGKTTKQFGAFHICLERTHRYLLAYKIAEKIQTNRDETLQKIVCIMANAPMITQQDMDSVGSGKPVPHTTTTVTDTLRAAGTASAKI